MEFGLFDGDYIVVDISDCMLCVKVVIYVI